MAETPACPRCGYDQRGVIDSWTHSCPLIGVCSECGLEFRWRYLLDPLYASKPGLFEHATKHFALCFLYTLWRSMRPWSFWRWVRMEDRTTPKRLLAFVLVMQPLMMILVLLIATMLIALPTMAESGRWGAAHFVGILANVLTLGQYDEYWGEWFLNPFALFSPFIIALSPLMMLIFGESMRLARVRRSNLIRIVAYSSVVAPLTFGLLAVGRWFHGFYRIESSFVYRYDSQYAWAVVPASIGVCFLWLAIWCAMNRYLRLAHAWAVALSISGISALLLAVVYVLATWWYR